ncbi:glutaminase [Egicoccus sp. AB-alg6-2]|uniref:glutaminase n=1 Tax=Egicoccus sp. AB-alg6-2 TaxID=3242692 RepID=UPI00359E9248
MTASDTAQDLDALLEEVAEVARPTARQGELADYIPALRDEDPDCFGLAMVDMDGTEYVVGDVDRPFAIQSISKVFSLVLAMQKADRAEGVKKELWDRVGVEPSGDPFNSLIQLEREKGIPRNPMINAGALVVDDVLLGHCENPREEMKALVSELAGEEVTIDERVADAEEGTSGRNRAIAYLMQSFDNLHHTVDEVIDAYAHQCAVQMTARQLARASRFLANDGVDPATGKQILRPPLARRVAAIMLTTGTYDAAGEFAFDVGLPCKSGVAGAIMALAPDRYGITVWSPPLDSSGNSRAGHVALHELAERLELSIF